MKLFSKWKTILKSSRQPSGALILMYHRVAEEPTDINAIVVPPENFARQMDYVRRTCRPMSLSDLIDALEADSLPNRAVAVTFDDGYLDNLMNARPILQGMQIPASVFVISGHIGRPELFWWDQLEYILLRGSQLPAELELQVGEQKYRWSTGTPEERQLAYRPINQLLRSLPQKEREQALTGLVQWAGWEDGISEARAMTEGELLELTRDGLIQLGAHTISHPMLSTLNAGEQCMEILSSRERLEEITGKPVVGLTYPYGDHSEETVRVAREVGFRYAMVSQGGRVKPGDNLFTLKRCAMKNWEFENFKQRLEAYFAG